MEGKVEMELGRKKKWCNRYLKLKNRELYISKNKNNGLLLVLDISAAFDIDINITSSRQFSFYIESNDLYVFSVYSEKERDDWISKLQEAQKIHHKKRINIKDFQVIKELGQGLFGKVYLAQEKSDNKLYALKVISKRRVTDYDLTKNAIYEKNILITSNHPFILHAKYTFQSEINLFLVTEYMPGGNLYSRLISENSFSLETVRFYSAQIALAIGYLHEKDVIHRDLKLENILIDKDGYLKLADFGLVKNNMIDDETTRTFCGTPEYTAPEMILKKPYMKSVDWWAFGCIVFEMSMGYPPFRGNNIRIIFESIIQNSINYPDNIDSELHDLLTKLLVKEPKRRLGSSKSDFIDVISHPFFKTINITDLSNKKIPVHWKPDEPVNLTTSLSIESIDVLQNTDERVSPSIQDEFYGFSFIKDSC